MVEFLRDEQMYYRLLVFAFVLQTLSLSGIAQYDWKLSKDKDGIKVYESAVKNSNLKSIKVECDLADANDKFISVMNDVAHYKNWVYNTKASYIIKRISPSEFYYYEETFLPWPISNRDAVLHLKMDNDSLSRSLKVMISAEPGYIPKKSGLVRVPRCMINWTVTSRSPTTSHHSYIFEIDPGGSVPAWLVNIFADRGPYETFRQLGETLKK
jgi:START domain-containing protein